MRRKKRNISYKADLLADLRNNAEFAAEYLSAAYADSRGAFLVALRDVVEATKGIGKVAELAKVDRVHLYRSLSEAGNPTLSTLNSIWDVLGLEVEFKPKVPKPRAPVAPIVSFVRAATAFTPSATTFTPSNVFRNVTTTIGNLILTDPVVTSFRNDSAWNYAVPLPPVFIAHVTKTDQSAIAIGD